MKMKMSFNIDSKLAAVGWQMKIKSVVSFNFAERIVFPIWYHYDYWDLLTWIEIDWKDDTKLGYKCLINTANNITHMIYSRQW